MQNQLSATLDTLEITPANGESTDLSGGFISFDYFESLFFATYNSISQYYRYWFC